VPSEGGQILPEGREHRSPYREALHEGRAVLPLWAAVLSPFRDDISFFADAIEGITGQRATPGSS
jgi:hypothetical protein